MPRRVFIQRRVREGFNPNNMFLCFVFICVVFVFYQVYCKYVQTTPDAGKHDLLSGLDRCKTWFGLPCIRISLMCKRIDLFCTHLRVLLGCLVISIFLMCLLGRA